MTLPTGTPYFSIVIPAYNRAGLVGRAIDSCLGQDWRDFEVVVVDDGSTDGTSDAVLRHADPRVRLVVHEVNRGVCPARNTGVDASRGEWIVFLDSDDELLPRALRTIHGRTREVGPEIHRVAFMYRLDTGGLSVVPPLLEEVWDYETYFRWLEGLKGPSDFCNVIRRTAFETVRYSYSRAGEALFHMEFCRNFLTRSCPDVVGIVHSDADNRSLDCSVERLAAEAPDNAAALAALLMRHRSVLRYFAPKVRCVYIRGAATACFLSGNRPRGLKYAMRYLITHPYSMKVWSVVIFGLLGQKPLAWLKTRIPKQ